jgi:hypothetical protein
MGRTQSPFESEDDKIYRLASKWGYKKDECKFISINPTPKRNDWVELIKVLDPLCKKSNTMSASAGLIINGNSSISKMKLYAANLFSLRIAGTLEQVRGRKKSTATDCRFKNLEWTVELDEFFLEIIEKYDNKSGTGKSNGSSSLTEVTWKGIANKFLTDLNPGEIHTLLAWKQIFVADKENSLTVLSHRLRKRLSKYREMFNEVNSQDNRTGNDADLQLSKISEAEYWHARKIWSSLNSYLKEKKGLSDVSLVQRAVSLYIHV